MKLISISSWQRHLFRREVLNWSAIATQATVERLFEKYRLPAPVGAAMDAAGRFAAISSAGGEYNSDGKQHTIEQLIIDPVSVQFQLTGDTSAANAFYEDLLASIENAGQTKIDRSERLTMTLQTMVTAKMDIDPWRFYSDEWKALLNTRLAPLVDVPGGKQRFWPQTFTTTIIYKMDADDFVLTPKPFTIEPRAGTTPEQSIFFVQSPLDSKAHLELLSEIENTFHSQAG
jgi:hypothetical protein